MKTLDTQTIRDLLEEIGTAEKRRLHSEKIRTSKTINGCQTARELSRIIDEAVKHILQEMELDDGTIVGEGGTGREEATPGSDFDSTLYLPRIEGFEEYFSPEGAYSQNMWRLFGALGIKGYPSVLVPGDFRGGDDDITLASLNMDARLLHGGGILTLEEIRRKVRAGCEPFYVASRHEKILKKFNYHEGRLTGSRNEYDIDFDIKEDRGGLRHLQHILWYIAAIEGVSLQDMYENVRREDPEVYNALDLMLHIRSWVHLKKLGTDDKKIDLLNGSFWPELRAQFGDDIIERIRIARRAIIRYERTRINSAKKKGIIIGDGTRYGPFGLEIDKDSWVPKPDIVIQLLINTQRTGGPISPYTYSKLEKDVRRKMTKPNDKYAELIIGRGKFSETIRRLISLSIIDQVFPCFSTLQDQTYHPKHRDARITPVGRILERLENFEHIIQSEIKNMYDTLSPEQKGGIQVALTCIDIPKFAEATLGDYFRTLKKHHPSIPKGLEMAEFLVEKHDILWNCSRYDDWYEEPELRRIAAQIGTLDRLNALLVYTCALFDYGKSEYYHKSLWDRIFQLYYDLKEEMEGDDEIKGKEYIEKTLRQRSMLSPEQTEILKIAPKTFLRSRYMVASDALPKTMRYLEKAQDTGEPQIKVTRHQEGSMRIIVSCQYTTEVAAIIAGTCLQNNITINDGEIHKFKTEEPLAVLFLEAGFSIPRTSGEQEDAILKLEEALQKNLKKGEIPAIDHQAILEKSKPTYILEKTNKTGNYKFIVTAENDTPGFLYALMRLTAESGVDIISTNIYTYPRHNGLPPHIEDTFILGPQNIDKLKELLGLK